MEKLSVKQSRERQTANPDAIAARSKQIAATFSASTPPDAITCFIGEAMKAVAHYRDLLPMGIPRSRPHRATAKQKHEAASAHRPSDAHRHGLIGDLYDAWMSARGCDDPDGVRGFQPTADEVLTAAGLPQVTERELRYLREQIKDFAQLAESRDLSRQK